MVEMECLGCVRRSACGSGVVSMEVVVWKCGGWRRADGEEEESRWLAGLTRAWSECGFR